MSVHTVQNGLPGLGVEVSKTYGGTPKKPTLWRGKVHFSLVGQEFFEVECALIEGREGSFVSMPQRPYEANGETKYANMAYVLDKNFAGTIKEAIETELGIHEPYDPESGKADSNNMPEPPELANL